ncbi:hypothetical protein BDP27DRAFT_1318282 [Rhodocollybia butyracea]|uniref:Ubiquitin-like protease family profile domain-containing protein n=1 Tax=Rhodocollybia butyracea TaxID=206335 RepID=A0A9P5UC85_9AGAR|nr:hypothetical protein BDP27DRAFT_1318282 [Rhodocollybia butyracea]
MNARKRPAPEHISSTRAVKQQRTALLNANGESQSPGLILSSRWKQIYHDFKGLGWDTVRFFGGRVVSDPTSSASSSEETLIRSPTPEQSAIAQPTQTESLPTTPARVNSFAVSQTSLKPTNLHASSSFSLPSTPQFSFTPRKDISLSSSQSSEINFPTLFAYRSATPSSSTQNPYSSRRPRTKTLMGPPPNPTLAASQSFISLEKTLTSLKNTQHTTTTRNYQNRPHILNDRHKQDVKKVAEETREALFQTRKKRGFRSNRKDFDSLLDYQYLLQTSEAAKPRFSSPSMIDLRAHYQSDEERSRPRRDSDSTSHTQWLTRQLENALQNAQRVFTEPRPPRPWSPNLDDLKIRHRNKDERIEQRLRPKRAPLPSSLPAEDDAKVTALLKQSGHISSYAKEQVSDSDIVRLKPGSWLNDEVINFYGALILGRSDESKENNKENGVVNGVVNGKKNKLLNAHYFSTFFWQKLERDGYEKGRLAKWTKKIDLFSKDIVLIPVNHNNMHWTAAAINFRQKRIESYDSMMMDRSTVFKRLRAYLDAEHRNKKKTPFDFTGWENHTLPDTPQQENGHDCGVFTCQFLETLSRGEETFNFTQTDIPYLRRRMIWEIGNAKLRTEP